MNSSKRILALWLGAVLLASAAWGQVRQVAPSQNAPAAQSKPAPPAAGAPKPVPAPAAKPAASPAKVVAPQHHPGPVAHHPAPPAPPMGKGVPPPPPAAGKAAPAPPPANAAEHHPRVIRRARKAVETDKAKDKDKDAKKADKDKKEAGKFKGMRDPFVSPVVDRTHAQASCTGSGRQCLEVSDINLQGTIKGPSGFIAVVANGERTYFLRVADPLANGEVLHITRDSITMRERFQNELGRPQVREVVRRVSIPPV